MEFDHLIIAGSLLTVCACMSYTLVTKILHSRSYPDETDWHRINLAAFSLAVWIGTTGIISRYTRENLAAISSGGTFTDAVQLAITEVLYAVVFLSGLAIALFLVVMFIVGIIGVALGLSDEAAGSVGLVLLALIGVGALSELVSHLQTATTDPTAHVHVLVIVSIVQSILLMGIIMGFGWVSSGGGTTTDRLATGSVVIIPILFVGYVAINGMVGPPDRTVLNWSAIGVASGIGLICGVALPFRKVLVRLFNYVMLLRPPADS